MPIWTPLLKTEWNTVKAGSIGFVYLSYHVEYWDCQRDDVIKWKHFPHYWAFVRRFTVHRWILPYKGRWRGALMFSLICAWTNGSKQSRRRWLRRHRTHYDVTVMNTPQYILRRRFDVTCLYCDINFQLGRKFLYNWFGCFLCFDIEIVDYWYMNDLKQLSGSACFCEWR